MASRHHCPYSGCLRTGLEHVARVGVACLAPLLAVLRPHALAGGIENNLESLSSSVGIRHPGRVIGIDSDAASPPPRAARPAGSRARRAGGHRLQRGEPERLGQRLGTTAMPARASATITCSCGRQPGRAIPAAAARGRSARGTASRGCRRRSGRRRSFPLATPAARAARRHRPRRMHRLPCRQRCGRRTAARARAAPAAGPRQDRCSWAAPRAGSAVAAPLPAGVGQVGRHRGDAGEPAEQGQALGRRACGAHPERVVVQHQQHRGRQPGGQRKRQFRAVVHFDQRRRGGRQRACHPGAVAGREAGQLPRRPHRAKRHVPKRRRDRRAQHDRFELRRLHGKPVHHQPDGSDGSGGERLPRRQHDGDPVCSWRLCSADAP